jgi:hypothetical protein
MDTERLVLIQGMADTKRALRRWNDEPLEVLLPWVRLSALITAALLLAIYLIATLTTPDPTLYLIPGYNVEATFGDYLAVLYRNSLVLALHAMACVAGFMAGSSLPLVASGYSGVSRWVHEKAGPLAIGFVVCATAFSLCTQAYIAGADGAVPAARGLDGGEPQGRLAGPPRGHLRHRGARRADAARGRGGRDLGLAPPAARDCVIAAAS